MRKRTYKNILWEKTYRQATFFDNAHDQKGRETGKWSGVLLIYRFLIFGGLKLRFLIEPDAIEFSGNNEEEMLKNFERSVGSLEEWDFGEKNYKEANLFPKEVNNKLIEFNLQKYVKKIS